MRKLCCKIIQQFRSDRGKDDRCRDKNIQKSEDPRAMKQGLCQGAFASTALNIRVVRGRPRKRREMPGEEVGKRRSVRRLLTNLCPPSAQGRKGAATVAGSLNEGEHDAR